MALKKPSIFRRPPDENVVLPREPKTALRIPNIGWVARLAA
jgi:hypothetical protein